MIYRFQEAIIILIVSSVGTTILNLLAPKVGLLHRFSRFLPSNVLQTLYIPLVQSYIDYAITV